ncbi:PREDICTED: probable WRKY transcription factor 70 [Nicotiana attenuata]|uniref:Wrky transcription factor 70 n=1 Tax=Nicotiana attenuata TaxID=49451 RepID=A0A314KN78_NICAT|nr:PREDICTED: probable WRKY transcription factor 70 [Nicotiana attenuata]OIT30682.1 putative wrky transcription factor 70 [Nicotiana attenuata]
MESPLPEKSSADLKRAIDGLIRGQEFTRRLKEIIKKPLGGEVATTMAEDLVGKIMNSFSETLSVIISGESDDDTAEVKSPEDSSGSCKSTTSFNDRRGCYKRRKTSETNTKESSDLVDDGHAWRKYGQKQILNSTYPRHYFRCTHKYDQKCQATKQVQKIQDNPPLFRTTYYGNHTCKPFPGVSQIILDTHIDGDSSILLSFDRNNNNNNNYSSVQNVNHNYQPYNIPTFPSIKQETKEEVFQRSCTSYQKIEDQNQSSNSDYFLLANDDHLSTPAAFEASGGHMAAALLPDVISSGVYSSCTSTDNLEIDFDFEESLWNFEGYNS